MLVNASPAHAWGVQLDKWWTNKFGEFDSGRWATQRQNTQRLVVDRCNHDWGPADQAVTVELREHKAWLPDVSHGSFKYMCNSDGGHKGHENNNDNDTDVSWVSGQTNSTEFFFKWNPDVDMRSSGIVKISHS